MITTLIPELQNSLNDAQASANQPVMFDRREFLKLTGVSSAALVIATSMAPVNSAIALDNETNKFNLFVSIDADGTVHLVCHRSEMGQGIRTGIAQILADELEADWQRINVVQGLADKRYGSQNTDGSRSIRRFYTTLRQMGASARTMLEQAAAKQWDVPVSQVYAKQGMVFNKNTDESLDFGSLSLEAVNLPVPAVDSLKLKQSKDFQFIGKDVGIVDMHDIQTGNTQFGQDVQLDGMLYACIARSPVVGAGVKSVNDTATKNINGVVDTWQLPNASAPFLFKPLSGVAVVANNSWAAIKGQRALQVTWSDSVNDEHDSTQFLATLKKRVAVKSKQIRGRGDAYAAIDDANETLSADYTVPYLIHAPMEPPAATAVYHNGTFEIWACVQTPQTTQNTVAQVLGVSPNKVKVHVTLLGGAFGRKSKPDFAVEAALLAKQFGKPVKVLWTREDEIQHGFYHAISAQHYAAGLDSQGKVTAWLQRTAFPSIGWTFDGKSEEPNAGELSLGFGDVPFAVPNLQCEIAKAEAHARIGWIRSVANIQHAFGIGCFVDELAAKANTSTYDMWMQLIGPDRQVDPKTEGFEFANYGDPLEAFPIDTKRLKAVLEKVVAESGADQPTEKNEGWGISVHRSFVSYVAVAVKVSVVGGKLSILEMHSAIDAGTVVNPDRVKSQQEGSMVFGASIALLGEISFSEGRVQQSNFHNYPVLRINQSPRIIETYIIESEEIPGGVGEPGTPPVAPAIANAIYHATGQRFRDLPLNKHLQV